MTFQHKDVCSLPTLEKRRARNLMNLFSKLLILQNNQLLACEPCQSPCWTMMVLFTWKRNLAWAAAFINFPFLLSPTCLFVMAWRRPVLGPAGCPVRMASPKISSSQRWPFCSFATADVYGSKRTVLSHSLFMFVTILAFPVFFLFPWRRWGGQKH